MNKPNTCHSDGHPMVFSTLGYIWASAREVRNFVCLKWKIDAERLRGGGIKDRKFKLQGGCSFSEEIKSNKTWFYLCVSLKIYYNTESPQDLRIKAISFSRSSEEYWLLWPQWRLRKHPVEITPCSSDNPFLRLSESDMISLEVIRATIYSRVPIT